MGALAVMSELHPTEQAVLDLITRHPGIQAEAIARAIGKTKGRISQIITKLKDQDMIIQYPAENRRGLSLKLATSWMHKRIVLRPWSRFRDK